MRKLLLLLLVLLLPLTASAEGHVINLIDQPDAPYAFAEDAPLLEVDFPRIHGSDACILRMNSTTMLVDASTVGQRDRLTEAFAALGIDHIDVGFNTHPHDDHLGGFQRIPEAIPMGKLILTCPEDANNTTKATMRVMAEHGIPVEHAADGDVLTLGDATLTVIQRFGPQFTGNDTSAMLMVRYGERTLLLSADVENRGQAALIDDPPACGLKADILKYPHHGQVKLRKPLYEMILPELSIATAAPCDAAEGYAYMKLKGVPMVSTVKGILRLRTDGIIWVVDYLPDTAA